MEPCGWNAGCLRPTLACVSNIHTHTVEEGTYTQTATQARGSAIGTVGKGKLGGVVLDYYYCTGVVYEYEYEYS